MWWLNMTNYKEIITNNVCFLLSLKGIESIQTNSKFFPFFLNQFYQMENIIRKPETVFILLQWIQVWISFSKNNSGALTKLLLIFKSPSCLVS